MNALTPTAQALLKVLREAPASAPHLREATGRGRSTIDKALTELAHAGLAAKIDSDGADGGPRWTLTSDATDDGDQRAADLSESAPAEELLGDKTTQTTGQEAAEPPDAGQPDDTPATAASEVPVVDKVVEGVAEEVKVCRGCGEQMPILCPSCRQKTTTYCGTCRQEMPARRSPGSRPGILANGLPKLTRGELPRLVADVMATQPLPDHLGVTGWTPGRIVIFLPGRSTGAIGNALDKLAATGQAHLIGEDPKRYQPTPDLIADRVPAAEADVIDAADHSVTGEADPDTAHQMPVEPHDQQQ